MSVRSPLPTGDRSTALIHRVTWWHLLLVGVVFDVAFYLVGDGPWRHAISAVMAAAAGAAILIGAARFGPADRRPWTLLAASALILALAEVIWTFVPADAGRASFPPPVALCMFAAFALQAVSLLRMAFDRWERRYLVDLLDGGVVATAVVLLTWEFVVAPSMTADETVVPAFLSLILPGLAVTMVWVVGHYLARPRPVRPAAGLLLGGLGLGATGIVMGTIVGKAMTSDVPLWFVGLWPLAGVIVGAAALHPTMVELTRPVISDRTTRVWQRLMAVGGAVLVTEMARHLSEAESTGVGLVCTLVLVSLVLVRLGLVLRDNGRQLASTAQLEARHRAVLGALEEGVLLQDARGRVIDANAAAVRLLDLPIDGITNQEIAKATGMITPDGLPLLYEDRPGRVALRTGISQVGVEFGVEAGNGTVRWYESNATRLDADEANPEGSVVSSVRDVTEKRESAQRLAAAVQESEEAARIADAANRAKSEFLSRMSHELRTPMNAVLGFGQLLGLDDLSENQQDSVDQIMRAGHHLLGLINDVLEISNIEAGHVTMSIEPVQVADVVTSALDLVRPGAAAANIEIRSACGPVGDHFVSADRQRLVQVLVNVLSNAVKYNRPSGRIDVACAHPAESDRLRILITDTGPGIAPELIDRVFAPFDRLGAENSGIEGTGIGLSLSRGLVEHMGGRIGVHSTPGLGSTFWIEMARTEAPRLSPVPARPATIAGNDRPLASLTVLYVEDNLSNRRLIERVFEARPHVNLLSTMLGRIGLDLATRLLPDLVMLDLHLPDIDGHQVLRELRANPLTASIPVAIVSADATAHRSERLHQSGADYYLTKPFDINDLLAIVDGIVPAQRVSEVGGTG